LSVRRAVLRTGRARQRLDCVGQITPHRRSSGLSRGRAAWAAACQIGWVRHHQPKIALGRATEIAARRIAKIDRRRLAPIGALRQRHEGSVHLDDRVVRWDFGQLIGSHDNAVM
jgi:hypothetical protein